MKTLLIDNYDSFTYNLFQLLAEVNGEEPVVVRNDGAGWDELAGLGCDNVVISPGPGRPERVEDIGVCAEAIRRSALPLLGVCIGHQGIGSLHGAAVESAPEPMHGRISTVRHDDSPLFAGIPHEFDAVRYHSLCLSQPLPTALRGIAWSDDGVLMALEHRERPLWGVQFHPESICTEYGRHLLANFRDLSEGFQRLRSAGLRTGDGDTPERADTQNGALRPPFVGAGVSPSPLRLKVKRLDTSVDPEQVFSSLYGTSGNAFWLDSSRGDERGRFSFIGDDSGPLGATVAYDVELGELRIERGGEVEVRGESIFDYLARELDAPEPVGPELPFELRCGLAGWLGYELKAECGGEAAHESPLPDAAFVYAGRMIAFDHPERCIYLLALAEPGDETEAECWLEEIAERVARLPSGPTGRKEESDLPFRPIGRGDEGPVAPHLARPRERYLEEIAECRRLLAAGETYEVCLTNAVRASLPPAPDSGALDPLSLYRTLRRVNPAPFSSYIRFGEVAVLSSSPERFLRVCRDRGVEARPIKGTSHRGRTPAEDADLAERLRTDEKNRAENLMIADLLRNDLGSVCEVGSVHVPSLIEVESYETVHQLVTAVRGRLRAGLGPLDCVRACFPPGSMTGAPKRRTMEIIDRLEGEARGPYAGAIGWFGLGGACDLSVAIRTVVLDGETARIGAGGAIVTLSDPEEEYEEMLLKASAAGRALGYSRIRLGASISRVTPRKSIVSGAAATTAP